MYKKIALFAITLFVAMSCLDGGSFTTSGNMVAEMEYTGRYDYNTLFGTDSLYFDSEGAKVGINWENMYFFYHSVSDDGAFQGGFLLSYLDKPKPETSELSNNKYRVNCAVPDNYINTYLVYEKNPDASKMPAQGFQFMMASYGTCSMVGCHVNNTVALAEAAVQQLELGEKVLFRATGYKDGTKTASAEIVLVEKMSPKDSVMSNWTQFNLDALKEVDRIDFDLVIPEGRDIPATVCMDNLTGLVTISY